LLNQHDTINNHNFNSSNNNISRVIFHSVNQCTNYKSVQYKAESYDIPLYCRWTKWKEKIYIRNFPTNKMIRIWKYFFRRHNGKAFSVIIQAKNDSWWLKNTFYVVKFDAEWRKRKFQANFGNILLEIPMVIKFFFYLNRIFFYQQWLLN
jgi:hypothetical protein